MGDLAHRKKLHMTTIGNFVQHDQGYHGTLQTLAFNVKGQDRRDREGQRQAPDYKVLAGTLDIGAAWKRQTAGNQAYLSVKLDDPSFAAPVNARLVEADNGNAFLYWNRRGDGRRRYAPHFRWA